MLEQKIVPVPEEQYKQLILLGKILGVSADDIVQLANLKEALNEVKLVSKELDDVKKEMSFIKDQLLSLAEYLQSKQDQVLNNWVSEIMKVFGGGTDEQKE